MDQLYEDLDMLDRRGRNRIIVFTQYKDTMHFIRRELRWRYGENIACYSGDGGEMYDEDADAWRNVGKERVKREFADDDGDVDILICTDSASEGLNLQECGALINYDLPWNPMRVEQRIGRIDRIGQRYDEVIILNYSYEDTVESDIYDRLDDRIGLFEYVVGDMQPILSGVGSKIRQATMQEGAKPGTKEYEDLEQDIERDIEEQQHEDDPIELKDSLAHLDSETPLRDQVIREARLDAWNTYSHPDLGEVGHPDEAREPVYSVESIEAVFAENKSFAELGITLNQLSELETEFAFDAKSHESAVYCLRSSEDLPLSDGTDEGTLAESIAEQHDGVGVTFSPDVADQYPSLRFLAPGSPLFAWLSTKLMNEGSEGVLSTRAYGYVGDQNIGEASEKPWLVCGWTHDVDDDSLVSLSDEGSVIESEDAVDDLSNWAKNFVTNRISVSGWAD
jgi:hypothetical protein